MSLSIETPYGTYEPRVPSQEEMARAAAIMADAVEAIAVVNHDMWAAGRIREGWRYGEKRDDDKKVNPDLVRYERLPESEKEFDIAAAKAIVAELMRRGIMGET